jgi:hypothetical protein
MDLELKLIATSRIAELNHAKGLHWFEPGTLRFFRSRYARQAYLSADGGHAFFVSSEKDRLDGVRLYSVRSAVVSGPAAGKIDTVGQFQQYPTRASADGAARRAALAR